MSFQTVLLFVNLSVIWLYLAITSCSSCTTAPLDHFRSGAVATEASVSVDCCEGGPLTGCVLWMSCYHRTNVCWRWCSRSGHRKFINLFHSRDEGWNITFSSNLGPREIVHTVTGCAWRCSGADITTFDTVAGCNPRTELSVLSRQGSDRLWHISLTARAGTNRMCNQTRPWTFQGVYSPWWLTATWLHQPMAHFQCLLGPAGWNAVEVDRHISW